MLDAHDVGVLCTKEVLSFCGVNRAVAARCLEASDAHMLNTAFAQLQNTRSLRLLLSCPCKIVFVSCPRLSH